MKKTAYALLVLAITLAFAGCSQVQSQQETSETQAFVRKAAFPIRSEVQEHLNPDDEYIACIDALYVAAKSAFTDMSPGDSVYDAALPLAEKETTICDMLLQDGDDVFRQWYLTDAFDCMLGTIEIITAGYENTIGSISERAAFIKQLRGADTVLNFYYADYTPILTLPEHSSADIIEAFGNNELAADKAYCNCLITVNGYIDEITKDVSGQYYVSLAGYSSYSDTLHCYFDETFEETVATFSKGDFVSFIVSISGKEAFDINATIWDIPSAESEEDAAPDSPDSTTNNNYLFGSLDLSKVWKIPFTCEGFDGVFHYVFLADNTCYLVISDGYSPFSGGKGTYQVNGSTIDFEIVLEGCCFTYGYDYDSETNLLIHTYGTPIMADLSDPGGKYSIEEDDANDISKIKNMAQDYIDSYTEYDIGV